MVSGKSWTNKTWNGYVHFNDEKKIVQNEYYQNTDMPSPTSFKAIPGHKPTQTFFSTLNYKSSRQNWRRRTSRKKLMLLMTLTIFCALWQLMYKTQRSISILILLSAVRNKKFWWRELPKWSLGDEQFINQFIITFGWYQVSIISSSGYLCHATPLSY